MNLQQKEIDILNIIMRAGWKFVVESLRCFLALGTTKTMIGPVHIVVSDWKS